MLGHVALRLRLVYESSDPACSISPRSACAWELVGLLPEDIPEDLPEGLADETPVGAASDDRSTLPRRRVVTEPLVLTLDRDEAEGYYLNLTSPQPSLFALLRLSDVATTTVPASNTDVPQAVSITASYSEAARWMDGGMVVIRTLLPQPLLAWIAEFAEYHFPVEGPKKRGKYRPSFLSRQEFGEEAKAALAGLERTPTETRH